MTDAIRLGAVRAVLTSAHELRESDSADKIKAVQALLQDCSALVQACRSRSRDHAPDHNLFQLLGIERSEVWLHSPFIADILDPFGTHGQGILFLRQFFRMLQKKREMSDRIEGAGLGPNFSALPDTVIEDPPSWEWVVRRERERIDISIRNDDAAS
jgi:hypothetical protein